MHSRKYRIDAYAGRCRAALARDPACPVIHTHSCYCGRVRKSECPFLCRAEKRNSETGAATRGGGCAVRIFREAVALPSVVEAVGADRIERKVSGMGRVAALSGAIMWRISAVALRVALVEDAGSDVRKHSNKLGINSALAPFD